MTKEPRQVVGVVWGAGIAGCVLGRVVGERLDGLDSNIASCSICCHVAVISLRSKTGFAPCRSQRLDPTERSPTFPVHEIGGHV